MATKFYFMYDIKSALRLCMCECSLYINHIISLNSIASTEANVHFEIYTAPTTVTAPSICRLPSIVHVLITTELYAMISMPN